MTVKDLTQRLKRLPQEAPVVLSRDEEGNGFGLCVEATFEAMEQNGQRWDAATSNAAESNTVVLWPML